jgi:hypothetical protein
MPSPCPGVDPYLEHPGLFSGVHRGVIAVARATWHTLLPQHDVADIGERVYIRWDLATYRSELFNPCSFRKCPT